MGGFIVCKLGVIIHGWVMVMGGGCCTCMGIAISSLVPFIVCEGCGRGLFMGGAWHMGIVII